MKFGMRKPSLKKSFKARTTGKLKRRAKKAINPLYGKKGMGLINNPKKALYNKVYRKTTFGVSDLLKTKKRTSGKKKHAHHGKKAVTSARVTMMGQGKTYSPLTWKICGIVMRVLAVVVAIILGLPCLLAGIIPVLIVAIILTILFWKIGTAWIGKAEERESIILETAEAAEEKEEHDGIKQDDLIS